jgi:hypothetical protein
MKKRERKNEKTILPLHLIFQPDQATEIFILSPHPDIAMKEIKHEP